MKMKSNSFRVKWISVAPLKKFVKTIAADLNNWDTQLNNAFFSFTLFRQLNYNFTLFPIHIWKKKLNKKWNEKNTKLITYLNCQMKMMILTKSSKMKYICIISLYVHSYDKCGLHVWFFFLHLYVNCPSPFVIYFALWLVNFWFLFFIQFACRFDLFLTFIIHNWLSFNWFSSNFPRPNSFWDV